MNVQITFIQIVELKYFLVSVAGLIFSLFLLYGVNDARLENALDPDPSRDVAIRKAGWRYAILSALFAVKIALSVISFLGQFAPFGVILLSEIPDLLLLLVFYEWRTDTQLMEIRSTRRQKKRDGSSGYGSGSGRKEGD